MLIINLLPLAHTHTLTVVPSPPYTPQYNSIAEQFNHSIIKMARAMLFSSRLPHSFSAKAIATVVHVHNWLPTCTNNNHSPHKMLHSNVPTLSHLHPFSTHAYLLLPHHKCNKLDPQGIEAHYLGPTHNTSIH
jgi:hypothetical protein